MPKKMMILPPVTREGFNHILAGLRALQAVLPAAQSRWHEIATDGGARLLTATEIDELCEHLNTFSEEV